MNRGESLFSWWIDHHQGILRNLLGDNLRVKYYGGFALNVQLTEDRSSRDLSQHYRNGTAQMIAKHQASDIDMKLFGLPAEGTQAYIVSRLNEIKIGAPVLSARPFCVPERWQGAVALDGATNYLEIADIPESLPHVKAIVAYLMGFPKDGTAQETGLQIVINGIYKNGACQTLSEITCFHGAAEGDTPETPKFDFLPITILCDQFIKQFRNLSARAGNEARAEKAFDRISKCLMVMVTRREELNPEQQAFWDGNDAVIIRSIMKPDAHMPALLQPPPEPVGGAGAAAAAAAAPAATPATVYTRPPQSATALSFIEAVKRKAAAAAGSRAGGGRTRRRKD